MRFVLLFVFISCFIASEAYFGEDLIKAPGDFFTSLMDKLKDLTGGKEGIPPTGNSSLPEPAPIVDEKTGGNGDSLPNPPLPVEKKQD